jgi:hypothetical protein
MRFRSGARLDTSQVSDRRGMGPAVGAGGGLIGLIALILALVTGDGGVTGLNLGAPEKDLSTQCRSGEDANQSQDCLVVGVVNSVQDFWGDRLPGYRPARTVFFAGAVNTGCGGASSAVGPFYCPVDQQVYIDLGFYDELRSRFGANGGPFAQAYVIAHEYGHHVENLRGLLSRAGSAETGPQSTGVRVELMADCLAGMWAQGAAATGFIEDLTDEDIRDGLNAAAAIGDDRIQQQLQGQVNPERWTHGSSEQRQRWFLEGYRSSDLEGCNTLDAPAV